MTCNCLMLLLEIYRSAHLNEQHCGTYREDLKHLLQRGLIVAAFVDENHRVLECPEEGDTWTTTAKGNKVVRAVLDVAETEGCKIEWRKS